MHLSLDHKDPTLKVVYELSENLKDDPEHMLLVQAMSLNKEKPFLGKV
jgi:hypothetical protein